MDFPFIPLDSQTNLLAFSRRALEAVVRHQPGTFDGTADPYLLGCQYGVFVTLHNRGELRGCIGTCIPASPLYKEVIAMTEAAASRDHRVRPIEEAELHEIDIEISLLSELEPVLDCSTVEIGRHGLHVVSGERRGVLLPQVAARFGWDRETFLEQTCLKAGLPKHAWKWNDTRIASFAAVAFGERR